MVAGVVAFAVPASANTTVVSTFSSFQACEDAANYVKANWPVKDAWCEPGGDGYNLYSSQG